MSCGFICHLTNNERIPDPQNSPSDIIYADSAPVERGCPEKEALGFGLRWQAKRDTAFEKDVRIFTAPSKL